jgi:cell division septum initiation protein DivIVA
MPEDPQVVSISSTSPVSPDEIARQSFPAVRKGVDGEAVRAYLAKVAAELRAVLEREAVLRERLGEAERRAAEPVLDEATLTKAIGMETARILSTAHEAARKVVEKAEADAAETLGHAKGVLAEQLALAESQASAIRVSAEQEAYEYAGRVQAEADAMTEEAHADAVELLDATKEECRRMVAEARDLRNRTLADLVSRRRELRVQLEELRGGKDSLLQVVDSVGAAVEQLRGRLIAAEHEARAAAEQAGERAEEQAAGAELGELEAELAAAARSEGDLAPAAAEGAPGVAAPSDEGGDEGTDAEGATAEAAPSSSRRSVDELFARIRASRAAEEAAAAAAQAVVAAAVDAIADGEPSPAGEPPVAVPETVVAPAAAEATPMPPGAGQTPTPSGGHESAEGPEGEEHESAEEPGSAEAVEGPADGAAAGSTAMGEGDDVGSLSAAGGDTEDTAEYLAILVEAGVTGTADTSPAAEELAAPAPAGGGPVFDVEALESEPSDAGVLLAGVAVFESTAAFEPAPVVQTRRVDANAITEPDVESLARRDHLLGPVTAKLGRALKRALQDDQNDLLNALRQSTRKPVLDELVPPTVQLQRFAGAATEQLAKAHQAGAEFLVRGDAVEGPSVNAPAPSEELSFEAGAGLAAELAEELSAMLRLRTEEALAELDGSLEGSADAAGVAYREWKGSRVEGLAGDFTTRAFAAGELAVLGSAANQSVPLVRWAVEDDDAGGSCPDCDDNSLAGPQPPGAVFPTGHAQPPVHPGCRCLLVPVRS